MRLHARPRSSAAARAAASATRPSARAPGRLACACGGRCPRCRSVGHDAEQEAETAGQALARGAHIGRPAPLPAQEREALPPAVAALQASAGAPLPADLRAWAEPGLGAPLGDVRLHTGTAAASSARALGARAWTAGRDIAFGAGRYQPDRPEGRALIAHELAHVVQQRGGPPTVQRATDETAPACAGPATDAEMLDFEDGHSEAHGSTRWVLRVWGFGQDDATPSAAHAAAIDAFIDAANLHAAQAPAAGGGWSFAGVTGHASPEGGESHNQALGLSRAEAVAALAGVADGVQTLGEACSQGSARADRAWYRAAELAIEFHGQSVAPEMRMPGVATVDPRAAAKADRAKAGKSGGNLLTGLFKQIIADLSEPPSGRPPRLDLDFDEGLKAAGESVTSVGADLAGEVHVQDSFARQRSELAPEIAAAIEALRPEAERLWLADPSRPVYAVVHLTLPKTEDVMINEPRAPAPGQVRLAEPVTLSREAVRREWDEHIPMIGGRAVVHHERRSYEIGFGAP